MTEQKPIPSLICRECAATTVIKPCRCPQPWVTDKCGICGSVTDVVDPMRWGGLRGDWERRV